jgi:hypothetical protein
MDQIITTAGYALANVVRSAATAIFSNPVVAAGLVTHAVGSATLPAASAPVESVGSPVIDAVN